MSGLRDRIVRLIEANGPLSIADYMAFCLFDPKDGYYTTREPFGASGDFTTAPEISQMFGELVAVWLLTAWRALGRPSPVTLAEIGPGRGTLMKDMLRVLGRLGPDLWGSASVAMIETSPRLVAVQKATLGDLADRPEWHETIDTLPRQPLLIVANELFDAIPIRQYVKADGRWMERAVGLTEARELMFTARPGAPDPALLPPDAATAPDGAIAELSPARTALMEMLAERVAEGGAAALLIDYGYSKPAVGDTLQGLSHHAYTDPLADPGKADLTAHVDFSALSEVAKAHGLDAHLLPQGEFLLRMGLLERAGQLGAAADSATRRRLQSEVDRLAGSDGMGTLFKVLAIAPTGAPLPAFLPMQ
ncbi:class I SAM-dependent methyltransferase [Mesorhizobium sp. BAC0120]|uniref:class I SAM-dependent methyltransferase n=1 Tax=Mesorhizobium sp. BAC0120 TaxID=3090670 RepID=UPI00298C6560|nr:class I SAM-dependent methyltransferase [Mesorhizobium sp. BAC0120]MDW6022315.1 class I SAM-dependent methyltransferase [Mesorhizobium sp. BAC0120]